MRLASEQDKALIWIALKGGKARAHWNHGKFNALAKAGLTEVIRKGDFYHTHRLTRAGIEEVLNLPDELQCHWFPLPADIAKAKQTVRELKR